MKWITQRMGKFNAQDLANIAWAFAKVGQSNATVFTALAEETRRRMCEFSAQDLASMAWAFAKADLGKFDNAAGWQV